jgi:hypothetical protein
LEGVEAWDRAVVASRGRAERMILEERFWGIEGADSSGIIALMSAIEHGGAVVEAQQDRTKSELITCGNHPRFRDYGGQR